MERNGFGASETAARLRDEDPHVDPEGPSETEPQLGRDAAHGEEAAVEASTWRIARSLETLFAQVNTAFPARNRRSDGTIGDARHKSRNSDHNPWVQDGRLGVVTAADITHDPRSGCDAGGIVESLRAAKDPRVKYLIWNRRIANSSKIGSAAPWAWRAYTGSNPHDKHCHISVRPTSEHYDSTEEWPMPQGGGTEAVADPGLDDALIADTLAAVGLTATETPTLRTLLEAQDAIDALLGLLAADRRVPAAEDADVEGPPSRGALREEYGRLWSTIKPRPENGRPTSPSMSRASARGATATSGSLTAPAFPGGSLRSSTPWRQASTSPATSTTAIP